MPDTTDAAALPSPEPRRLRSLAPLIIGFLLLVAVVAATGGLVGMQRMTAADMLRGFEQRTRLANLFSALQDAETGQRGYLLTGDDAYLQPYRSALSEIETGLNQIGNAFSADPALMEDVGRLRAVSSAKLTELSATIDMRRAGRAEDGLALVRANQGKRLMDEARVILGRLGSAVSDGLKERQSRAATMSSRLQVAITGAVLLAIALAAYAILDARTRNRRLARSHALMSDTYAALVAAHADRERLEAQLRQSQKMEAMGHLTGGLAHDFNNMLAIIIGNLHLLKRRLGNEVHPVRGYADQALDAATRAATLTQRLLAFARKQPLTPEPIDSNRLLAGMSDLLRRSLGESVQVETVLAGGLWPTDADANQLESAILNLAVNARDAMPRWHGTD